MFKLKNGVIVMDAVGKGRVTIRVSDITALKSKGTFSSGGVHIETGARSYRFNPGLLQGFRGRNDPKANRNIEPVIREAIEKAMQGEEVELSLG